MNTTPELSCDVLIIGSGAAGLSLALRLAEKHQVIVLSKGRRLDILCPGGYCRGFR